jgi:hypothetical protein
MSNEPNLVSAKKKPLKNSEMFTNMSPVEENVLTTTPMSVCKNKTLDIVRQVVTGKGALTKGFVHPNFTRKYHPHPDSEERQGDHQEEGGHVAEHRKRDEDEADMMDDGRYAIMALLRDSR